MRWTDNLALLRRCGAPSVSDLVWLLEMAPNCAFTRASSPPAQLQTRILDLHRRDVRFRCGPSWFCNSEGEVGGKKAVKNIPFSPVFRGSAERAGIWAYWGLIVHSVPFCELYPQQILRKREIRHFVHSRKKILGKKNSQTDPLFS